jgi:hypothetical protein
MSSADERNEKSGNVVSVKDYIGNDGREHRMTLMQILIKKVTYSLVEILLVGSVALILLYMIKKYCL